MGFRIIARMSENMANVSFFREKLQSVVAIYVRETCRSDKLKLIFDSL